jgi:hypothetical protein
MKTRVGAILLIVLGLMSLTVYGSNNAEAVRYCEKLQFESDRSQCLQSITGGYYDDSAVGLCRTFGYVSDQHNCLVSIRNRLYDPAEISLCGNTGFDSEKMNCLASHGRGVSTAAAPVIIQQQPVYVQEPIYVREPIIVRPAPIISIDVGPRWPHHYHPHYYHPWGWSHHWRR